jgi:hypothetical protein
MAFLQPARNHDALARATTSAIESEPALWGDDEGKLRTASLIVAVEFRESSFRNDVISKTNDACAMQINARPELAKDAVACVRTGIHMLRDALSKCSGIQIYVGAPHGCHDVRATRISDDRMALAGRLLAAVKP